MIKPISLTKLDSLCENYQTNLGLSIESMAAFLNLAHLEDYISQIKARHNIQGAKPDEICDTIKICFVRYEGKDTSGKILLAGKGRNGKELSQTSLILVPVNTSNAATWESKELEKSDGLLSLCVCEPNVNDQNHTGLCPPNENCERPRQK